MSFYSCGTRTRKKFLQGIKQALQSFIHFLYPLVQFRSRGSWTPSQRLAGRGRVRSSRKTVSCQLGGCAAQMSYLLTSGSFYIITPLIFNICFHSMILYSNILFCFFLFCTRSEVIWSEVPFSLEQV